MEQKIYSTGIEDLDKYCGGLSTHSLMTIGGRPGIGKTALMLSIACHFLEKEIPFAYISLSENAEQITKRLISNFSDVYYGKILFPLDDVNQRKTGLNGIEYQRIISALAHFQKASHVIYDNLFSIGEILEALENIVNQGISVIFIDDIQLTLRIGTGDLYEESSKIIHELKIFANKNNVSIIISSQLSRKVEERQGHRPRLSDLRDTGSFEEASDQVVLLLRREYYDPMDKPGMGELIVAKNRLGETCSINVTFNKETGKFSNFKRLVFNTSEPVAQWN